MLRVDDAFFDHPPSPQREPPSRLAILRAKKSRRRVSDTRREDEAIDTMIESTQQTKMSFHSMLGDAAAHNHQLRQPAMLGAHDNSIESGTLRTNDLRVGTGDTPTKQQLSAAPRSNHGSLLEDDDESDDLDLNAIYRQVQDDAEPEHNHGGPDDLSSPTSSSALKQRVDNMLGELEDDGFMSRLTALRRDVFGSTPSPLSSASRTLTKVTATPFVLTSNPSTASSSGGKGIGPLTTPLRQQGTSAMQLFSPGSYFASKSGALGRLEGDLPPSQRPHFETPLRPDEHSVFGGTPAFNFSRTAVTNLRNKPIFELPAIASEPSQSRTPHLSDATMLQFDSAQHSLVPAPSTHLSQEATMTPHTGGYDDSPDLVSISCEHLKLVHLPPAPSQHSHDAFKTSLTLTNLTAEQVPYELIWPARTFDVDPSSGMLEPHSSANVVVSLPRRQSSIARSQSRLVHGQRTMLGVLINSELLHTVSVEFVVPEASPESANRSAVSKTSQRASYALPAAP
ncbi:hypothetical protein RI367_006160 [Sorochytrium milnesiophthora]